MGIAPVQLIFKISLALSEVCYSIAQHSDLLARPERLLVSRPARARWMSNPGIVGMMRCQLSACPCTARSDSSAECLLLQSLLH